MAHLRFVLVGCAVLLSLVFVASTSFAFDKQGETKARSSARPIALKPSAIVPDELPAAFQKAMPASIADLQSMERHVEELVQKISASVVAVEVRDGSGSGVLISEDGLVLTAGHVCGQTNWDVRFTFPDGKSVRGKTISIDSESDTGLMKISGSGPLPHVELGELASAQSGDWVLALGHPGGFDLRRSLVVRLGRLIRLSPDALQTDCTISPGDSGGPLFDMHGRVIGIHSFISTSMAENFHVPITAYHDWQKLVKIEKNRFEERSAFIGATGVDDSPGCRLTVVDKQGPAFKAGLKPGDVVINIEGRDILASASFRRWIEESAPGETLNIKIRRGTDSLSFSVKLGLAPHKVESEEAPKD
jgi:serine protease Do